LLKARPARCIGGAIPIMRAEPQGLDGRLIINQVII
jgi:hypothetical protein